MGLPSDELRALDRLLEEVLDLADDARARWFETLPAEHARQIPELRARLTRLGHGSSRGPGSSGDDSSGTGTRAPDAAFSAGALVGRYRLIRELGAGGMGVVWLAEGTAGHLTRRVALKLPLLVINNRSQGGRFARERDILASLAHPNIARLYDAGITPDGQPYLALEYIEGQPLPAYCDERRMPVSARLALFGQVLRAVQYAHANLVIHRDLKPSNILVATDGDVRLLDFGIAKLVTDGDGGETELTRITGSAHTPAYASPEQVAGAPVSIASDVYSLGVILYELLCGARPYRPASGRPAALEEAILHAEPPPPSTVVTDEAAHRRGAATGRKLAALLEGDLDTIALKALKKAPDERYPTVAALAEDLARHLRGDPIEARADSAWYRGRKLLARHRAGFAATAVVAVALIAGASIALWQAQAARAEAARANAVQQFMLDLFRANSADQADPQRARQTTARELLDRGVARIGNAFADQPVARLELLETLARLYAELGLWAEASDLSRQQVALARALYGGRDPRVADAIIAHVSSLDMRDGTRRTDVPLLLDEAQQVLDEAGDETSLTRARLHDVAASHYVNVSVPTAREHAERAVAIYRAHHATSPDFPAALRTLANVQLRQGEWPAAQATMAEAVATARALDLPEFRLVDFLHRAGELNAFVDNVADADAQLHEALRISERINGPEHSTTIRIRRALLRHLIATSRLDDAETVAAMVVAAERANPGREAYQVEDTRRVLLELHSSRGNLEAERALADEAIAAYGATVPATFQAAALLVAQASPLSAAGKASAAAAALAQAQAIASGLRIPRDSLLLGNLTLAAAHLRLDVGDPAGARALLEEQQQYWLPDAAGIASSRAALNALLASALVAGGDAQAAVRVAADADAEFARSPVRKYGIGEDAQLELAYGRALMEGGDYPKALPHLERSVALYDSVHIADSPWRADAEIARAVCLLHLDRAAEAGAALASAHAAHRAHRELGEQFRAPLRAADALARQTASEPRQHAAR